MLLLLPSLHCLPTHTTTHNQSGKTQISAKAVMVDAEATPLDQVMEARRKVIKRLDEAVFECKETLDRKADTDLVDEVENRSNDVRDGPLLCET